MDSTSAATLLIITHASFVLAMIFLAWTRSWTRGRKEPSFQLSIAFLFGVVVAVVIAITLELLAPALLSLPIVKEYGIFVKDTPTITFLMVVIIAPFIEEFAKPF